ncbi:hypothetical protein AQ915_20710 [Burkholderia pseudomallei]|uniref:hypothetical protein n=1 Tax=Burkholderia pseudomallei TaxID=28450 RepID=UPI000975EC57|nr:hypothetical protein [Burkholderia pseudomallei]ONC30077.1 hypothetical protein AQ915_20710 [Burkholderia pseudomallei]
MFDALVCPGGILHTYFFGVALLLLAALPVILVALGWIATSNAGVRWAVDVDECLLIGGLLLASLLVVASIDPMGCLGLGTLADEIRSFFATGSIPA